ncbi:unnamed protein product, partial [Closterium sp. Yama58-4]
VLQPSIRSRSDNGRRVALGASAAAARGREDGAIDSEAADGGTVVDGAPGDGMVN